MTCIKCCKTILFVVFSLFVNTMSAMDHRQMFAEVWVDHAQTVAARECFQVCCADDQKILNVTKHLIGHKHMMEISEINGTIPTSWLLISKKGEDLSLFKFLRELYTVEKVFDLLRSPLDGQSNNRELFNFLKNKDVLLQRLERIFMDGAGCRVTRDQSNTVLMTIGDIKARLIQEIGLVDAKKFAEAFARQLIKNPGSIKDLTTRVQTEIQRYEAGGVNVDELKAYVLNVKDLKPLIALVQNVAQVQQQLAPVNWDEVTAQIRGAVDPYFRHPLSQQIDASVLDLFVPTIRSYASNFAELDDAFNTVEERVEKEEAQISAVALSFLRVFRPAAFKTFVVSTLGDAATGLNVPKSAINVTAVLKSTLSLKVGDIILHVEKENFGVLETFIATLFPK